MQQQEVIDVRVKGIEKVIRFLARGLNLKRGFQCILETEWNRAWRRQGTTWLNIFIREATLTDVSQYLENKDKEKRIFATVQEQITRHDLSMKLIKAELLLDARCRTTRTGLASASP